MRALLYFFERGGGGEDIERFSYDLEMKTREQNKKNKRSKIERFDWFIEWIQTRVIFGWFNKRSGEKTSCPRTFWKSTDTSLWRHTATRLANRTINLVPRALFPGLGGGEGKATLFFGGREATTGNASAVRRLLKLGKKCVNSAKKEKRERGNVFQFVSHKKWQF